MSHCCSSGNVVPLTRGTATRLGGHGVKWPVRSCTPKLHVLVGHTASFGSNSPRRGTAAHCSPSSADLYTGFQAVGAITTASKALLQSPVIESLASLFASNSTWHLLQHLALFSASHYQIFLTLISPTPLLFSQLRTTVSPSIHSLTAQQINRSQPLRYFHMGQTLLATRLPCPVVQPGHGAPRTQKQDVRMRLGLYLNHSHGFKLLDCAGQSRVVL